MRWVWKWAWKHLTTDPCFMLRRMGWGEAWEGLISRSWASEHLTTETIFRESPTTINHCTLACEYGTHHHQRSQSPPGDELRVYMSAVVLVGGAKSPSLLCSTWVNRKKLKNVLCSKVTRKKNREQVLACQVGWGR